MKRAVKWLIAAAGTFVFLAAAAFLTLPYWFGAALGRVGSRHGFAFARYERLAGGRFALTDFAGTNQFGELRAARVEGLLPYTWYRNLRQPDGPSFLQVGAWRLRIRTNPSGATNAAGLFPLWKMVEPRAVEVRRWLPRSSLRNGVIQYGGREYAAPLAEWNAGSLSLRAALSPWAGAVELQVNLAGPRYEAAFQIPDQEVRGLGRWGETNGGLALQLSVFLKDSRGDLTASFGSEGFRPATATLNWPDLRVPGKLLKLESYRELSGSAAGEWRAGAFQLRLAAHADAVGAFPPIDVQLLARGNADSATIEQARSTLPGWEVAMTEPIQISYGGRLLSDRSELRVAADLEKWPWLKGRGRLDGFLSLTKGEPFPAAAFRLAGSGIEGFDLRAERIELSGAFRWPRLEDLRVAASFATNGTGGTLSAAGSIDLERRALGETSLNFEGSLPARLLPDSIRAGGVKLRAVASGSFSNVTHSGQVELKDFIAPGIRPLEITAGWKGRQRVVDEMTLQARAGTAACRLAGRALVENARARVVLRELTLSDQGGESLRLEDESVISASSAGLVEVVGLKLAHAETELDVRGAIEWPLQGKVNLRARGFGLKPFQSFITAPLREWQARELELAAHWSNGPVLGSLNGSCSVIEEHLGRVETDVKADLTDEGLNVAALQLSGTSGVLGMAQGFVPLRLEIAPAPRWRFVEDGRLDFELKTGTNQPFWSAMADRAQLRLTNAAVDLAVRGSMAHPAGEFHLRADALQILLTNRELPVIGPIEARLALNEQVLRVREISGRVLDQPVRLSGQAPLGTNFWVLPRAGMAAHLRENAEVRLEAPRIALAPFSNYLPDYLSARGELSVDVAMKPGRKWAGRLAVRDVETRPLPDVGVIQSVQGEVKLSGNEVTIEEVSGVLGGERMVIRGRAGLSPESAVWGHPDLDLRITGKDLPLARNPDVILRSDLDLRVSTGTNQTPVISGTATLRDSFLLRDVSTLVPGRLARPSRRPPYFSIEQAPIRDWKLDVQVRGENFMRVRSPFFQGVVSANYRLSGTMLEPMALGESRISSGQIIFPFATLDVRQALVTLASQEPYMPHLFAVATGRAFGFDIRMEAEGPANAPVIQFSSVPALSSEQIVLMLTTGQIPRDDFSFSNKERVSKLAFFLGKSLLAKLRPGKADEEKLTIRSGQDITEQGRQTYEVEYKLSPRWSLVGEYDRFGALNANVKWRIISR